MNRAQESLIAFAAALALGTLASAADAPLSPCKLLTKDDVKAALGGGEWQVWEDMGSEEVCVFQGSPTTIVTLTLFSDTMGAAKILELRKQLAGPARSPWLVAWATVPSASRCRRPIPSCSARTRPSRGSRSRRP